MSTEDIHSRHSSPSLPRKSPTTRILRFWTGVRRSLRNGVSEGGPRSEVQTVGSPTIPPHSRTSSGGTIDPRPGLEHGPCPSLLFVTRLYTGVEESDSRRMDGETRGRRGDILPLLFSWSGHCNDTPNLPYKHFTNLMTDRIFFTSCPL